MASYIPTLKALIKGKVEKVFQFSTTEVNYIIARLNETNNNLEYRVTYFTQIVKKVIVNARIAHWNGHRMQFCANK
jgi:ribosomal protein L23